MIDNYDEIEEQKRALRKRFAILNDKKKLITKTIATIDANFFTVLFFNHITT